MAKKAAAVRDWEAEKAAKLAARKLAPGTCANLGVERFLDALRAPDGFTMERFAWNPGWNGMAAARPAVRFVGHDGETAIEIVMHDAGDEYAVGDGRVNFKTSRGNFSFDRHGVEDSFYVEADHAAADVQATLTEQVAKVTAARERHLRSETVPFVGHIITPERKAEIAAKLQAGKAHAFTPSGFGTGYNVSTRKACRWSQKAPQEMAAFFGVPALYYETMDCD